jgi:predicted dehydrogenase
MRLLILGTGGMANHHAEHFAKIEGVEIVGGVDVDQGRVDAFSDKHNIPNRFTSLDAAIAWGQFDAATNVTPDKIHYPTTMALLKVGKHVMCEKPLAENHAKALEMTEAAEKAGVINMVNLTYRNVAPLQKARAMVLAGEIGTIRHIEASYLQSWLVSKAWGDWRTESQWLWRLSKKHGSNGTLGDVGIHILDFAGYGSGLDIDHVFCRLKAFDKAPGNKIGEYELDANDSFTMAVDFSNGALGVVHSSRWATGHLNELKLRMYGEKGGLEVRHTTEGSSLHACTGADIETGTWHEIDAGTVPTNYDRFVEAVCKGVNVEPTFRHATNLQKVLDLAMVAEEQRKELKA